jgi:16S rRNA (adenine1518-N6/adenine1519-N6)-dimethyltransferase
MKIKAKKSLGQNFLFDKNILKIISECTPIKNKDILEVGPGTGNLTNEILKKVPNKLFLIEKDTSLINNLKEKLSGNIIFINDDILKISEENLTNNKLTVFGNLPYNISTEILTKWILSLNSNVWFEKLILMFQKEVAERIISSYNTSNYGRLSIISNWKLNIEKVIDIKPQSFYPKPKVDSSLLILTPKVKFFKLRNAKTLEQITRIFFNQRRKKIKKPFYQLFDNANEIAERLKIDLNLRPQNLKNETYYLIAQEFEKLKH